MPTLGIKNKRGISVNNNVIILRTNEQIIFTKLSVSSACGLGRAELSTLVAKLDIRLITTDVKVV